MSRTCLSLWTCLLALSVAAIPSGCSSGANSGAGTGDDVDWTAMTDGEADSGNTADSGEGPDAASEDVPNLIPDGDVITAPDGEPDPDAPAEDVAADGTGETTDPAVSPNPPVDAWGPLQVGTREWSWFDSARGMQVVTRVWYPATGGGDKAMYIELIEGEAHEGSPPDASGGPYPLVLFSHGFKGIHVQSVDFVEYIASHGYVVAAPNHVNNTMFDFNATDEDVAKAALERPADLRFVHEQMLGLSTVGGELQGMVDGSNVAVTGHSFGGYTALVAAGALVDVDKAKAACAAGVPSDIFCPYMPYWPDGAVIGLDPPIPGVKGAIYLAPGGYSAFGDEGLASIGVPGLVFGGTLDHMTEVDVEIHPIYEGHPEPRFEAIVKNAGHMSFTVICALPGISFFLDDFCGIEGLKEGEETFLLVNPIAVSFLNFTLKGDLAMPALLSKETIEATYPDIEWTSSGMP